MGKDNKIQAIKAQQISVILPTTDQLTGRAGLGIFALYLRNIVLFPIIERMFGSMRKSNKGLAVTELFVQILSFFMDGTSRRLTWFDHLATDPAWHSYTWFKRQYSGYSPVAWQACQINILI